MNRSLWVTVIVITFLLVSSLGTAVITVSADQPKASISNVSVSPNDPVTGETITLEVEVTNLESSSEVINLERISVRTAGGVETHTRVEDVGSVAPGGSASIPLTVSFDSAGEKSMTVHALVRGETGGMQAYEYPVLVDVSELNVNAELSATTLDDKSTRVELANFGNVEFSDIETIATVDGDVVDRKYMSETTSGSNSSISFDTEGLRGENITFTTSYTAEGSTYTISRSHVVNYPISGEISLTSVEISQTGTGITISGEAANIGSTNAGSVLLSVRPTDSVNPTAPSGEYFIGTIESSEFATFELTADAQSTASSVPIEITYLVDGEQITTTQQIDYESVNTGDSDRPAAEDNGQGQPSGPGGGLPLTEIGTVVVLLIVSAGGFAIYRWRNQ